MTELDQNRLKWIEALESGEYKQTTNYLKTKNGFCCLGVACDLYDHTIWIVGSIDKGYLNYAGKTSSPPNYVNEYFGLDATQGLIDDLINMNDSEGKTFSEIAEYLRDVWELPK